MSWIVMNHERVMPNAFKDPIDRIAEKDPYGGFKPQSQVFEKPRELFVYEPPPDRIVYGQFEEPGRCGSR